MDLATTDIVSAKMFCGELFGWEAKEMPAGEAGVYAIPSLEGDKVCGFYEMEAKGAKGASRLAGSPTLASRTPTQPPLGRTSWAIRCKARRSTSWTPAEWRSLRILRARCSRPENRWVHIGADRINNPSCLT